MSFVICDEHLILEQYNELLKKKSEDLDKLNFKLWQYNYIKLKKRKIAHFCKEAFNQY